MRKRIISLIFTSCISYLGYSQTYKTKYIIDSIPNISNFYVLNSKEIIIDSLNEKLEKKDKFGRDKVIFKSNRSRVYIKNNLNDFEDINDNDFIPLFCNCEIKKDTISIETGWSFYGTIKFNIRLVKNEFAFTIKINDEIIDIQFQKLILDKKPNFEKGEKITGLFIYSTKEQGIKNELIPKTDQINYEGKIYFTCINDIFLK